jgi:uncharacterized repeat protein (TIGR01451 family)/CSLREA domain-containing protein
MTAAKRRNRKNRRAPYRLRLEPLESRLLLATFAVDSTADEVDFNPGDGICATSFSGGVCTLRAAIQETNALANTDTTGDPALDPDIINVPAGTYTLTIVGADEHVAAMGDLDITDDLTIVGAGSGTTIIQAGTLGHMDTGGPNGIDRVFHTIDGVRGSTDVSLSGITIRHGNVQFNGGGIFHEGTGTLSATNTVITNNQAGGIGGGGIRTVSAPVNLTDSTVSNNRTAGVGSKSGGGIQTDNGELTLLRTTLSGNTADSDGGGIRAVFADVTVTDSIISGNTSKGFDGGGIHNDVGTVTITRSIISGNNAEDGGGILTGPGPLIVESSTISGNTATGLDSTGASSNGVGGGIASRGGSSGGSLSITDSTISGNTAALSGGGINIQQNIDQVTITRSTISGNTVTGASSNPGSGAGGGINAQNNSIITLTNVTVSGNTAQTNGGGIQNGQNGFTTMNITNSTITDNTTGGNGGGIFSDPLGTVNLVNTLIAENTVSAEGAGPDVSGAFVSQGNNLIGIGDDSTGFTNGTDGDQVGSGVSRIDPQLDDLTSNGGPTETHALCTAVGVPDAACTATSPAINAGDTAAATTAGLTTDQRGPGFPRVVGSAVDIGSFEVQTVITPQADLAITKTDSPDPVVAGANLTYTITVTNNGPNAAQGVSLSDAIPANTTFVSFTAPAGWTSTTPAVGGTGSVSSSRATLAAGGGPQTFTLVVKVDTSAANGSTISNTVSVSSATDTNSQNNSDTETTAVNVQGDVSVTKKDSANPVAPGENLTYTITVTSAGPSDAQNVTLSDAVPANTTFVSFTQTAGPAFTLTPPPAGGAQNVTASISTLAAGASATFVLVVQVDSTIGNDVQLINIAIVNSSTNANPNNDNAIVITRVAPAAALNCEVVTLNSPGDLGTANLRADADGPGQALIVTGTSRSDVIVIEPRPVNPAEIRVKINGRLIGIFDRSAVQHIVAFGLTGSDKIVIHPFLTQSATLFGNEGDDYLFGASGADGVDGGNGRDRLFGGPENDTICGGLGLDRMFGQAGDDFLGGDAGNDKVFGEAGNDFLVGNDGNDNLFGGIGNDRMYGQAGNDQIFGEPGNDIGVGGDGNDKLFGGSGRDVLIGGDGFDTLFGEAHDDILVAGSTVHDEDDEALQAILAEWTSPNSYATRVNNLRNGGGQNWILTLDDTTVIDDGLSDTLWGNGGLDWFLFGDGDKLKDKSLIELVN